MSLRCALLVLLVCAGAPPSEAALGETRVVEAAPSAKPAAQRDVAVPRTTTANDTREADKPAEPQTQPGNTTYKADPDASSSIATPSSTEASTSSTSSIATEPTTETTQTTVGTTLASTNGTSESGAVTTPTSRTTATSATTGTTKLAETTTARTSNATTEVPEQSPIVAGKPKEGLSSGIIAVVMAIVFAVVVVIVYAGLLLWRRYLEYRYGNRELLVNDLEFDTNDLRHFEL